MGMESPVSISKRADLIACGVASRHDRTLGAKCVKVDPDKASKLTLHHDTCSETVFSLQKGVLSTGRDESVNNESLA